MARRGNLRGRSYSVRFGKGLRSPTVYPAPIRSRLGRLRGSAAGVVRRRVASNTLNYNPLYKKTAMRKMVRSPVGGVTSLSTCFTGNKRGKRLTAAKMMQRIGAPNFDISQTPYQLFCPEGFQNATQFAWNPYDDLHRIMSRVPAASPQVTGTIGTQRFELTNVTGELLITNSSLATAYVEIYDLVCKRDSPAINIGGAVSTYNAGLPVLAWANGVDDAANSSTSGLWQTIKSLPFDSQIFNLFFKVVRRHHVGMPQGSTHRHSFTAAPGKIIDNELLETVRGYVTGNETTGTQGNFQGLTMFTMVVAYGQPASITGDTAAVVTTAKIALDIIQTKRYKYTWIADNVRSAFYSDSLSSLTGEQVVSLGAGQIVANAVV